MPTRRLEALDGLRGVAALMVVVYHSMGYSEWFREGMYEYRSAGAFAWLVTLSPIRSAFDGRVAVMAFFVLSGFVLSRNFWKRRATDWPRYYLRRGLRLYPPVFASAALAVVLLGMRQAIGGTGTGLVDLDAAGTSTSRLFENMGLVTLIDAPLNVVWWSLRWEVWFSILLPAFFVALVLFGCGPNRRFRTAPVWFGLACVSLVAAQPWIQLTYDTSYSISRAILYLPMFGLGIAVAAFERQVVEARWRSRWKGWLVLGAAFALLATRGPLGSLAVTGKIDPQLGIGLAGALPLLGVALLVVVLVGWPVARRTMSVRPVVWLGERSYSLYLVHLPLVLLLGAGFAVSRASVWFVALSVASSLGLTVVFYRCVERPSAALASRSGRRRTPEPPVDRPVDDRWEDPRGAKVPVAAP